MRLCRRVFARCLGRAAYQAALAGSRTEGSTDQRHRVAAFRFLLLRLLKGCFLPCLLPQLYFSTVAASRSAWKCARGERSRVPPGLSLGRLHSRGLPSSYSQKPPLGQAAPTTTALLPAQRLWSHVPAFALEPAVLPGSPMPARGSPLAGRQAPGPTTSRRSGQSPACRRGTCAP
jgi:hypothetical protein